MPAVCRSPTALFVFRTTGSMPTTLRRAVVWEAPRTPVRRVLAPGEIWTGGSTLQAPVEPGRYLLQVDLVREGVAWFSRQGTAAAETTVHVE